MTTPNQPWNDQRLAEYLAGEMSADDRARFEETLREDSALAADVAELRQTLAMMSALDAEETEQPEKGVRPHFLRSAMRYAAIIAMAFVAGYAMRGGGTTMPAASEPNQLALVGASSAPRSSWEQRVARAYAHAPGGNSFGKSLIALVQSNDTKRR